MNMASEASQESKFILIRHGQIGEDEIRAGPTIQTLPSLLAHPVGTGYANSVSSELQKSTCNRPVNVKVPSSSPTNSGPPG